MAKPMKQKQCNHAGCRQLVPYDVRYCDKHQHKANVETYHKRMYGEHEGRYQQFYKSSQWRKLSRRLDESNLRSLCHRHHQRKTRLAREQREQSTK